MKATVSGIDRIWNSTEAMLNQQTFDAAIVVVCVRYVCDKVCRILNLSENEYYMPSSGLIHHILRWAVMSLTNRCGKLQWRLDTMEKVREIIGSRYVGRGDVSDSD